MKMMYGDGVLLVFGGLHNSQRAARKSCSQSGGVKGMSAALFETISMNG
jgi:hypothetical protein